MYRVFLPYGVKGDIERQVYKWMGQNEILFENDCQSFIINDPGDMLTFRIIITHPCITFEKI